MKFLGAVLKETGKPLQIESLALKNLSNKDVVVRIKATSLCHTDLEAVEGLEAPAALHELAGQPVEQLRVRGPLAERAEDRKSVV